jgi:hypothetical protein
MATRATASLSDAERRALDRFVAAVQVDVGVLVGWRSPRAREPIEPHGVELVAEPPLGRP